MPNTTPILELANVNKRYSGLHAVSDVSFTIKRGAISALIGPNGAGKSTTFNLISGLETVSSGHIRLDGQDVTSLQAYQRARLGLARIFQNPCIFEYLTVLENVMVGLHTRARAGILGAGFRLPGFGAEEKCLRRTAMEQLEFVGLESMADRMAGTLPFGGQRLLEFARALAIGTKLILLDEPTAGLTPLETEAFADKLAALVERGNTILIVEHNLGFITAIAGRIIVLAHGRKIYDGAANGLRGDAAVVEAYIGTREKQPHHA